MLCWRRQAAACMARRGVNDPTGCAIDRAVLLAWQSQRPEPGREPPYRQLFLVGLRFALEENCRLVAALGTEFQRYRWKCLVTGAGERSRTSDLRITNALLYQLSYTGNMTVK